jgi:hypothetical protein
MAAFDGAGGFRENARVAKKSAPNTTTCQYRENGKQPDGRAIVTPSMPKSGMMENLSVRARQRERERERERETGLPDGIFYIPLIPI